MLFIMGHSGIALVFVSLWSHRRRRHGPVKLSTTQYVGRASSNRSGRYMCECERAIGSSSSQKQDASRVSSASCSLTMDTFLLRRVPCSSNVSPVRIHQYSCSSVLRIALLFMSTLLFLFFAEQDQKTNKACGALAAASKYSRLWAALRSAGGNTPSPISALCTPCTASTTTPPHVTRAKAF